MESDTGIVHCDTHLFDLMKLAFVDGQMHMSIIDYLHDSGLGDGVFDRNSRRPFLDMICRDSVCRMDAIGFGQFAMGWSDAMDEVAVVGTEQESGGVLV